MLHGGRSYPDFRRQVPQGMLSIMDSLREYCLSLDGRVVEDVRMHRVVFGKSFSFRWFADAEPADRSILLKLQRNRKVPADELQIADARQLEDAKGAIRDAFLSI